MDDFSSTNSGIGTGRGSRRRDEQQPGRDQGPRLRQYDELDIRHLEGPQFRLQPPPPELRQFESIVLCLSGGGYRAAAYHLGALRRLHEMGILHYVSEVRAVSGGAFLAGWLADRIAKVGPIDQLRWEADVAEPFRGMLRKDVRTLPVLATLPLNGFWKLPRMAMLERRIASHVTSLRVSDIPTVPKFQFLSTDLIGGALICLPDDADLADWPLARLIAISAAFPPMFGPLSVPGHAGRRLALVDGGVWGNLGVSGRILQTSALVLVSDASYPLLPLERGRRLPRMWIRRTLRVALQRGDSALRHQMWSSDGHLQRFEVWRINETTNEGPGLESNEYSRELTLAISRVRTDLDRFSEDEISVLENHGYLRAASSVSWLLHRIREGQEEPSALEPMSMAGVASLARQRYYPLVEPPHARLIDEAVASSVIRTSSRRVMFRR